MNSGIYKIINLADGKMYIGSAVHFNRRFARHIRQLNSQTHPNKYLQNAWNLFGEECFRFEIVQYVEKEYLLIREQHWIDTFNSADNSVGYNICKIADNRTGVLHTEEAKLKMSKTRKGMIKSEEWQAKITASLKGKKRSAEVVENLVNRLRGRKLSDETRAKMSAAKTGLKHSDESKLKRSLALRGRNVGGYKKGTYTHSEETRRKISEAHLKRYKNA